MAVLEPKPVSVDGSGGEPPQISSASRASSIIAARWFARNSVHPVKLSKSLTQERIPAGKYVDQKLELHDTLPKLCYCSPQTLNTLWGRVSIVRNLDSREMPCAVLLAVQEGNVEALKSFLRVKADPNECHDDHDPPLFIAVLKGRLEIIGDLVAHRANLNDSSRGCTPVMVASEAGHVPVLKCLKKHGATLSSKNKNGTNGISLALLRGHAGVIKYLLKAGVDGNKGDSQDGVPPVVVAVQQGLHFLLRVLLEGRADPDGTVTTDESRGVNHATRSSDTSSILLLSAAKANVNTNAQRWTPPISNAAHFIRDKTFLVLHKVMADAGLHFQGYPAMWHAVQSNNRLATRCLAKARMIFPEAHGKALASHAVLKSKLDTVPELYNADYKINTPGTNGLAPLGAAAKTGDLAAMSMLWLWGERIFSKEVDLAVEAGHAAAVAMLTQEDPGSFLGSELLELAAENQHAAVLTLLLEVGYFPSPSISYSLQERIDEVLGQKTIAGAEP